MHQISLKSIIINLLKNRKITLVLLNAPLVIGIIFGILKSTGRITEITEEKREILQSQLTQYNALKVSNDNLKKYLKESIYVNLADANVVIKEYKVYINEKDSDEGKINNTGAYFSELNPEEEDYEVIKNLIANKAENRYLKELIPVRYMEDSGILTVSGIYSDSKTADKLAEINLQRILNKSKTEQISSLEVAGSEVINGPDKVMLDKISGINNLIEEQTNSMDKLRPGVVLLEENTLKSSLIERMKSVFNWAMAGLLLGVASVSFYAMIKSSNLNNMTAVEIAQNTGTKYLGFVGNNKLSLLDKMQIGKMSGYEMVMGKIISVLAGLLKSDPNTEVLIIGKDDEIACDISARITKAFENTRTMVIESADRLSISEIKPGDIVLLNIKIGKLDKERINEEIRIAEKLGLKVAGFLISN